MAFRIDNGVSVETAGACNGCDRGTLASSGPFAVTYPYSTVTRVSIGNTMWQVIRLCDDCRAELAAALRELK